MNEHYPTILEMMPWHTTYPITRKDWWHIFRWPKLWSVAPDDYIVVRSNEPQRSLHELMDETFSMSEKKFFVLLFGWIECSDACPNLKIIADKIDNDMNYKVNAIAVTNYYDTHSYDMINNIVADTDDSCAKMYGATGESIFVMDREKRIVWKSSGLLTEKLYLYLKSA